jgi:hypothetical protein
MVGRQKNLTVAWRNRLRRNANVLHANARVLCPRGGNNIASAFTGSTGLCRVKQKRKRNTKDAGYKQKAQRKLDYKAAKGKML